ncbi:uncharacterized protein LOC123678417 [Harmonia axyridis]|uniref:uncharacterized protein LOC123678417 n=1 Tax=Harmonia axyridis TaxID=115357 RepID=UPI001E275E77|nr:uncharacterized protein LOC123678417 [Harmonia axyridis]
MREIHLFYIILVYLYVKTVFSLTAIQECKPRYHYWRPYTGKIPEDAFRAGDRGDITYVAKIIPLDINSWSHAGQIGGYDYVDWGWPEKWMYRVDKFLEILCTEPKYKRTLQWRNIYDPTDLKTTERHCCLVESGVTYRNGVAHFAYVGRKYVDNVFFVGPVYMRDDFFHPKGMFAVHARKSYYFSRDFEILHYGCVKS